MKRVTGPFPGMGIMHSRQKPQYGFGAGNSPRNGKPTGARITDTSIASSLLRLRAMWPWPLSTYPCRIVVLVERQRSLDHRDEDGRGMRVPSRRRAGLVVVLAD
ncbi:MAG TPA: hypothetical protein VFM89_10060, partial [Casimicrobiaceae bacterium]|nr:hypothetical protein [Casimicrobiaceae bacterium]